ncbi:MAG: murein L,D-transpeptidase family protein [Bdellovibrionales bacterium]
MGQPLNKKMFKSCFFNFLALFVFTAVTARAEEFIFLVDKTKFQLHQAVVKPEGMEIVKTYKTTLGKASGDKEKEGDLKTPEGIYRITNRYTPPSIKKKFGMMAFYINYPNAMDRLAGKTGFDIMLHATDDPKRLELNQDSDGCVVVSNEQILELDKSIKPQQTQILIYDELKPEYLRADFKPGLKAAFETWLNAWKGKDIDTYINAYHADFKGQNMNLKTYREYKAGLNKKYETIDVMASDVNYLVHPKYAVVTFMQKYSSTFPGGRTAFSGYGRKALYFTEVEGNYKIVIEDMNP